MLHYICSFKNLTNYYEGNKCLQTNLQLESNFLLVTETKQF